MQIDLIQGTLDMLVLKALARGSMHGYGIARWLESTTDRCAPSGGGLAVPGIASAGASWAGGDGVGHSENNRRAKYYA